MFISNVQESRWKIGQLEVKTKIYQTIESLIILFIKSQFSNQVKYTFRLLYISIFNLNLNLNLDFMVSSFVSSPIYLFYDSRPSLH